MTSLKVSPRLLSIFGKSLYSGDSLEIVSRELIQNSRDACILNKGKIEFKLENIKGINDSVIISCHDRGIGMNLDVLENVFLSLGETLDNSGGDKIGGFGIAKASIFASDNWGIHTLDNYLDFSMLNQGENTKHEINIHGTNIFCEFKNRYLYNSTVKRIIELIEFSDIDQCEFEYINSGDSIIKGKIGNSLKGKLINPSLTLGDSDTSINVYLIPPIELLDKGYSGESHKGLNIYRLGGLVQFINNSFSNRDTNIIIDIQTKTRPGDSNYPFSMSREKISNKFDAKIYDFISYQDQNALTSLAVSQGKRKNIDHWIDNKLYNPELAQKLGNSNSVSGGNYSKNKREIKITPDMKKIFKAFSLIMEKINNQESFFTGITADDSLVACRQETSLNIPVYLINPENFLNIPDKDTICISLWHVCIHEFSHRQESNHNENFTAIESSISRDFSPDLFKLFNYISRVLFRRLNTN